MKGCQWVAAGSAPILVAAPGHALGGDEMEGADVRSLSRGGPMLAGKVLNLGFSGEISRLDETSAVWSGVATDEKALVRAVSFGPETTKRIEVFGKPFQLPFRREGDFYRLDPGGTFTRAEPTRGR